MPAVLPQISRWRRPAIRPPLALRDEGSPLHDAIVLRVLHDGATATTSA